jgi:hypothetical protein
MRLIKVFVFYSGDVAPNVSNNNKVIKDTMMMVLDFYTLAQG